MDGLLGVTGLSAVENDKKVVSTVEFKINFLSPALLNDQLLGIGKVEQKGNRLIIISGDIICPERNNIVIAKAIGTFNAYPAEKAGYSVIKRKASKLEAFLFDIRNITKLSINY